MLTPPASVEPGADAALEARFDFEFGLLTLSTGLVRPWPIGVDYDALVIIDGAADGMVDQVEVLVRRSLWRAAVLPDFPASSVRSGLRLSGLAFGTHYVEDADVIVETGTSEGLAAIWLNGHADGPWVPLSSSVAAMLVNDSLRGFLVRLATQRPMRH